jgi:hypothetical protein
MKLLWFLVAVAWGIGVWAVYAAVRWSLASGWPVVPCLITMSSVQDVGGEKPYRFRVAYQYSWAGRPYVGETYREDYRGSVFSGFRDVKGCPEIHGQSIHSTPDRDPW